MAKKLTCPCGRTIFDISEKKPGDELHCPWCSKTTVVPDEKTGAPPEKKKDAAPKAAASRSAAGEEKSLDELLAEEEASKKRRPEGRETRETRQKIPGVGRGVSEKWFLLLWTSVLVTGVIGYFLTRSVQEGGHLVIDWDRYPWWFWVMLVISAMLLGLLLQIIYVLIFVVRPRRRMMARSKKSGGAPVDGTD